jgi:hypothetical protein
MLRGSRVLNVSEPIVSAAVGRTLAQALAWVMFAIDKADEDAIDTDTAVSWQEDVVSLLDGLATQDRHELAALCRVLANESTDGNTRSAFLAFIEGCGLEEDDQ